MKDSGFAAGMLQKDLLVQGRIIRSGSLRILSDAREAAGQSDGVSFVRHIPVPDPEGLAR